MLRWKSLFMIMLVFLLAAACRPGGGEPGQADTPTATPTGDDAEQVAPEALPAAIEALAAQLGVSADEIELEAISDEQWPNACLGLPVADEMCAEVITQGFLIELRVGDTVYHVRTDELGNAVRIEEFAGANMADAVNAAIEQLSADLGMDLGAFEVASVEPMEWPDACLGLAEADEACAQVITPGFLIILRAGERVFEVRTDEAGQLVRFQETSDPQTELPAAVVAARQALANELGVDLGAIEVVSYEQQEWTDSCLGLGGPAESCLQAITPGWRVMLEVDGETHEVRTDETGNAVRIAGADVPTAPGPADDSEVDMGDAVLFFHRSGGIAGEVFEVRVHADGMVETTEGPEGASQTVTTTNVDPVQVQTLVSGLELAGIADLAGDYVPENTCCDRFLYVIALQSGNEVHTIRALDGGDEVPEEVRQLIDLVEAFVDTQIDNG